MLRTSHHIVHTMPCMRLLSQYRALSFNLSIRLRVLVIFCLCLCVFFETVLFTLNAVSDKLKTTTTTEK